MKIILILMLVGILLSGCRMPQTSEEQLEKKANSQGKTSVEKIAIPTSWPLEKKLNPERKRWVVVIDRETSKFMRSAIKRCGVPGHRGLGLGGISEAEGFIQSGYPSIVTFSPDQISKKKSLRRIRKYHYLFILPITEIKKIVTEGKSVIVSRLEGESYITLIAAPDKESLKKAIVRFLTLEKIPLEPIIFSVKTPTSQ